MRDRWWFSFDVIGSIIFGLFGCVLVVGFGIVVVDIYRAKAAGTYVSPDDREKLACIQSGRKVIEYHTFFGGWACTP